ncbi:hypothetical protein KDN24_08180 [Bacillus sp. Bva_UNVM-123]|uniref:hypothetical protein n=1 Tax=Bacillus sp. Bva_UNVM-123 TaxID=2829798 RepID=UPI00391FB863
MRIFMAIGCFFIAISAFLYATKHITAAIISANMNNTKANYYEGAYELVGFGMSFWIIAALLTGVSLLFVGIWPFLKNKKA